MLEVRYRTTECLQVGYFILKPLTGQEVGESITILQHGLGCTFCRRDTCKGKIEDIRIYG